MDTKQIAPGAQGKRTGTYTRILHKGKEYFLNRSQFRLYSLLLEGGKYATFDIADRLDIPDPRSVIRYLRKMGIYVADIWCRGDYGTRFKRYFIRKEVCDE